MTRTTAEIFDVKDKVVCLTGAAGLIGNTIAKVLHVNGAKLILCDLEMSKLELLYADWTVDNVLLSAFSITEVEGVKTLVNDAKAKFGRIDVLVNNAAIDAKFEKDSNTDLASVDFADFPIDKLQQSIDVNITGTIKMTQAVVKLMIKQQSGNVVNLASTYSLVASNPSLYFNEGDPFKNKPMDYLVTKSFIPNFTRYLATHYAKDGIRCNAIAPHAIDNNHDDTFKSAFKRHSPVGRMSDRSEFEGAFLYLISNASSYMTGHTMVVDGGWTAW
jgi:NAD(P)-dependent dehydrogenase (short-subunit alcohol dehydrogenase family)